MIATDVQADLYLYWRRQHVFGIMSHSNYLVFMSCSFKGFHILQTGFLTSKRIISGSHLQSLMRFERKNCPPLVF